MSLPIKATLAALMAFAASPAEAQWLGPHFGHNISLTRDDMQMMQAAVTGIHGKPVGTAASWDNPQSGNSGAIELLKKLTRHGRPCEELRYTLRASKRSVAQEHYIFVSCLQLDNTWKLTEDGPYSLYEMASIDRR